MRMYARPSVRRLRRSDARRPVLQPRQFHASRMLLDRAAAVDGATRTAMLLQLQRQVGNGAVRAMLGGAPESTHDEAPAVARQITAARGRGAPIEARVRERLEHSYGADLSTVRVHTDAEAHGLAESVNARAFTSSSDIFFSRGAYAPSTSEGFETLAHEVAHVVQQSRGPVAGVDAGGLRISQRSDHDEVAAQRAADQAMRGSPVARKKATRRPTARGSTDKPAIQRLAVHGSSGIVTIQRAPQPLVPLGDFDLMFNPSSSIDFTAPGATTSTKQTVNDTNSTANFSGIPRGSSGTVTLDVAMQWFDKSGPVPGNCDVCEILRRALTFQIAFITISPPQALVDRCRQVVRVDPEAIRPILDEITDAALDPCGKLLSLLNVGGLSLVACPFLLGLPGVAQTVFAPPASSPDPCPPTGPADRSA